MQVIGIPEDRGATERSPPLRGTLLAPWQAQRVSQHVDAHLDEPLRVADLANLVGLRLRQFSAAFRGSFGQTPHTYLLDRRVRRACELMAMTREPLSQIAVLCGFADQAHLTHIFRARIGITPNAWRRPRHSDGVATGLARQSSAALHLSGLPSCLRDLVKRAAAPQGCDRKMPKPSDRQVSA